MSQYLDENWKVFLDGNTLERLDATPFLARCRAGTITRAELEAYVAQQHFYSRHFTRYLCALLSNIAEDADRLELTENLLEEMGFGENRSLPHSQIYRNMMTRMGVRASEHEVNAETQKLIDAMYAACRSPDPMVGLAALCLGAEAIVPHLYSQVVHGFRSLGEPEENLEFFLLHIEEDDAHAETMRKIIERVLAADPSAEITLRKTATQIILARAAFFEAISQEGKETFHAYGNQALHVQGLRAY